MYPNEPTETELLNQFIQKNAVAREDVIREYIEHHNPEPLMTGVEYYFKKNKITTRQIYKYDDLGKRTVDTMATNNKLASGWHKLLVDQKVGYLVGKPISITGEETAEILGDKFNDTLPELVKNASNKGIEWLHVYIDSNGDFDYIIIPAQEFIPIYDNTHRQNLVGGIRYYELRDHVTKIEVWDEETVTYYEMLNGKVYLDSTVEENPQYHFAYQEDGYGWGRVPFIPFRNNEEEVPDITFYKDYIDAYDYLMSETTNTLQDIQQLTYIIKGYDETNPYEFLENVRRYKSIKVDEEGGVDTLQAEVPMDSVDSQLDRFIEDIYQFGQGVNTNTDKFGNSPSGIALKFLFSMLDMKANVMERKFTFALKQLAWFAAEYASIADNQNINVDEVKFTFNKSMLMNEREQAEIAQMSKGVISDETIRENHPWVSDPAQEKERMEQSAYPSVEDMTNEEPTGTG